MVRTRFSGYRTINLFLNLGEFLILIFLHSHSSQMLKIYRVFFKFPYFFKEKFCLHNVLIHDHTLHLVVMSLKFLFWISSSAFPCFSWHCLEEYRPVFCLTFVFVEHPSIWIILILSSWIDSGYTFLEVVLFPSELYHGISSDISLYQFWWFS